MNNLAFSCIKKRCLLFSWAPYAVINIQFWKASIHLILPAGDKISTADVTEGTEQRERDQDKEDENRKARDICTYLHIERQLWKLQWEDF